MRRRLIGSTSLYALAADPRFSYCLFVPDVPVAGAVLVTVHGTERDAVGIRDALAPVAQARGLTVVSPLFPAGIDDPDDLDNYKFIRFGALRFDELLIQILQAAQQRTGADLGPLHLVGFSGGAQFVHRFLYLHPELLASVSIAAPGRITLLDPGRDWWAGTRDVEPIFGVPVDVDAVRGVPVQIVVGTDDVGFGATSRGDTARALHENYLAMGVSSRLDIVPGARHELAALLPAIAEFLGDQLCDTGRFVS